MYDLRMRKPIVILLFSAFSVFSASYSQDQPGDDRLREMVKLFGQAKVTVPFSDKRMVDSLSSVVSVLDVRNGTVEISLSPLTVEWFISQKTAYSLMEPESSKGTLSATSVSNAMSWDAYPTYPQYDSIMQSFAINFPSLCRLDTIGLSIRGKLILALKISDNAAEDEEEPDVFYTSTMHGDETGGFVLMLRLADFLLNSYTVDEKVRELVDNLQIWINPLSNPDGTYNSGNTISLPVRYNANGVDLNRNFPDPTVAPVNQEKENVGMISFMEKHHFVLSANFHSGSEVVNYPWDRWITKLHPDNDWFNEISRAYADTVHLHSLPGYMTDLDNGVTRGSVWYVIHGGRQDYVTGELHGREVTIELDNQFVTPATELASLWESNRRSLTGYLENALYGIHGVVMDSETSRPLPAEIFIDGHDQDGSQAYADTLTGRFVRLLSPGIWPLTFSSEGYHDTTVNVQVIKGEKTDLQMYMTRNITPPDSSLPVPPALYPNPASSFINALLSPSVAGYVTILITDPSGRTIMEYEENVSENVPFIINTASLSSGTYSVTFINRSRKTSCRGRFIIIK
jgi:hypothetical protein